MDPSHLIKKRKTDDNGAAIADVLAAAKPQSVTPDDARKMIEPLAQHQLMSILQDAVARHSDVLDAVRAVVDLDPARRKLFIRGIGPETTTGSLRALFSPYGEIEEAIVITDKATGKSKGYGFVIFKHVDGAVLALKEPSKRIDGRMSVTQLASAGSGGQNSEDVAARKIYVGNIPIEVSAERLLDFFMAFGDIEEGPLGFDRQAGKPKGFAFFVFKTEQAAKACVVQPSKNIDGHQVLCKLAADGKKDWGSVPGAGVAGEILGGTGMPSSLLGLMNLQFGGSGYPGYGAGTQQGPGMVNSSLAAPTGVLNMGTHGPAGGAGGYGLGPYIGSSYFVGPGAAGFPEGAPFAYGSGGLQPQSLPVSQPLQGPSGAMHQRFPPYY